MSAIHESMKRDYPLLWEKAGEYDFAERLGGCTDPLMAEIDEAMRELFAARTFVTDFAPAHSPVRNTDRDREERDPASRPDEAKKLADEMWDRHVSAPAKRLGADEAREDASPAQKAPPFGRAT